MNELENFYGKPYITENETYPPIINAESLKVQFTAFKHFAFTERYDYEEKQRGKLDNAQKEKSKSEKRLETLGDLISQKKRIREQKNIKTLEKEIETLQKMQKFTFVVMLQRWYNDKTLAAKHPDITRILLFAALIPPSTAEVERTFSLMKLICTRLRVSLTQVSLAHCIRISKFRTLSKNDYKDILKLWLRADDTKTKKRRVQCRLKK